MRGTAGCDRRRSGDRQILAAERTRRREESRADFLWSGCDALTTPAPLGPLVDIAARIGRATADCLQRQAPRLDIFAAVVDDLARRTRPAVVIVEDVHWADQATLDLLKYVGGASSGPAPCSSSPGVTVSRSTSTMRFTG